jgi:signal transduction histidine kinase
MNFVSVLGKAIEIAHSNLEIASRINAILNIISSEMQFDEVLAYTLEKDKRLSCSFSNRDSRLSTLLGDYRCHVGEGVIGTVAQKRSPRFFTAKDIPPRLGCLFYVQLDNVLHRYRSFAFLPLSDDGSLFGVLVLCSSTKLTIDNAERRVLSILARELGGILQTYELFVSSKQRIGELATLSDLGRILTSAAELRAILNNVALITARALNALFATLRLDPAVIKVDGQRFTSGEILSSVEPIVLELEDEVIRQRLPLAKRNEPSASSTDPSDITLFSVPILAKDRLLGTITLCSRKADQDPNGYQEEQHLLATIANYISSGLENALLNISLREALRELSDAQRRLIQNEKLRSLGEMTANIAHEIRTPLVIIGGFTKRLAKKPQRDDTENRYIEIINKEVFRLESILAEVLGYVKETPPQVELCNLNRLLDEIVYLLASDSAWGGITIARNYDRSLGSMFCDAQQLKQVLLNMLMNSFEAMHGTGTVTIATRTTSLDGKPFVAISIADTGGGIAAASLENIFNPFFTTKERGSGLGLAISNKIVTQHGGHIEVKNEPGEGATFIVYLPADYRPNRKE